MDEETIAARLRSVFGYPEKAAVIVARDLLRTALPIREAVAVWLEEGRFPEVEAEGYSLTRLVAEHSLKPPAALLTLDWLLREPTAAKEVLRRGYDRVLVDAGDSRAGRSQ